MSEPDSDSSAGGAEAPDDAWPQLERRDWSSRPADAEVSSRDRPDHDTATPATDVEPEPDEPA